MATHKHVPNIRHWANDDLRTCSEFLSGGHSGDILVTLVVDIPLFTLIRPECAI